jgi:hypothetical protein
VRARVLAAEPTLSQSELNDAIDLILLAGPPEDPPLAGIALPPVKPAQDFADEHNEKVRRFMEYAAERTYGDAESQLVNSSVFRT